MKKMVKLVMVLGTLAIILAGCGKKSSDEATGNRWDDIKSKGEIVIGIDDTFVPMGFRDENNEIIGFDIDLAKAVAKEMGVEAKFQPIDWSLKETELTNGTIDVIWNGYTITDERKNKVDFSDEYLQNQQVLVSLKDSTINSFADMKNKILGAQEGSSGAESFENNPTVLKDLVKDNEPVLYPTFTEAFLDLEAKRIDGLLIDKVFAEYYISQQDNPDKYVLSNGEYENENFAIGAKKGETELVNQINSALKKAYQDGSSIEISKKWFGEDRLLTK